MAGRSLFTASFAAILSLSSGAAVLRRTDYAPLPPCSYPYTPFDYVGCYVDPAGLQRALDFSAGGLSQNMTVEVCTATCKSNGFRYAGIEYYGECFCGNSINGPVATSESECSYACTGNKTQICGGSNRVSLYMDPTFTKVDSTVISDYMAVGCYSEASNGRAIQFNQAVDKTTMTTESCLAACKIKNYPLAATEYSGECYCGVVIGNGALPADSSKCNMPCAGNQTQTCGGAGYLNLYAANDLQEAQPCAPVTPTVTMSLTTTTTSPSTSTTSSSTFTTSTSSFTTSPTPTSTSTQSTTSTTTTATPGTTTSSPMSMITSTTKTTTTTTSSACISAASAPACEYGCGNWCSKPLPEFRDKEGCGKAYSQCKLKVADCFSNAGYPHSNKCYDYRSWCEGIGSYYKGWQDGKSNKSDCYSKNPPKGGPATTAGVCTAASTSSPATTTKVIPPTATNVCVMPSGKAGSGYEGGKDVGDIDAPIVTCNDDKDDYSKGNLFKSYTSRDTGKCPSYPKNGVSKACQDACKVQYNACIGTYAETCKGKDKAKGSGGNGENGKGKGKKDRKGRRDGADDSGNEDSGKHGDDDYNGATTKCNSQLDDCLAANQQVTYSRSRCSSYDAGWS